MTCRHCLDAADLFSERVAGRELSRYRRRGPSTSTRLLLRGLLGQGVENASFLDIGGGVGAIQQELLAAGARQGMGVDASGAYLEAARAEAERRGTLHRLDLRRGDVVDLDSEIPDADVVTLDRVLCCYPDMERLVAVSCRHATRVWGAVLPRESLWVRFGVAILNAVQTVRRKAFRVHLHGVGRVEERVRDQGFVPVASARTWLWEVRVFVRTPTPMVAPPG
jgi:magnesium-protoporphyrin O-methyltransferase